jgi:acetyl esterase/lipase
MEHSRLFSRASIHRVTLLALLAFAEGTRIVAAVDVVEQGDEYVVSIDNQEFARYDTGSTRSRPFFREVRAADGTLLSRPISPPGGDHPHHTGIWLAIDEVNGTEFWHAEGRIQNESVVVRQSGANPARLQVRNGWLAPDGKLVLQEETTIAIYENRLLVYDIVLTAADEEVSFGDTEEGFFAFRMADSMREEAGGRVRSAAGVESASACWGRTSPWVDYCGEVAGNTYGVAIFDHPLNFRPGRYHVRDYGLFTINPFGEHDYTRGEQPAQPLRLPPGQAVRLRYGMYFHAQDTQAAGVADAYQEFLSASDAQSESIQEITYRSSADGTVQPAMFFRPDTDHSVPLLVALHTWSGDYRQDFHAECAAWCQREGWAYIHPNFRGPNRRPEATGSELVVQDIVDAVAFARQHARIDPHRVYLAGTSGGGYAALLMAGRHPELWSAVSAWVPVTDLEAWYHECLARGAHYAQEVVDSCGGPPGASAEVDRQYERRSAVTWLGHARGVPLDINAGIRDGHQGSVPVSHTLRAFNAVAQPADRVADAEIDYFVREAAVPPALRREIADPSYGAKRPLFRRQSGQARVTLFEGGHEMVPRAALEWLARQRRRSESPE